MYIDKDIFEKQDEQRQSTQYWSGIQHVEENMEHPDSNGYKKLPATSPRVEYVTGKCEIGD